MTNPNQLPSQTNLEDTQPFKASDIYSEIYAAATFGGERPVVLPSKNPKGPSEEHIEALAAARRRIGHLTGYVAVKETRES